MNPLFICKIIFWSLACGSVNIFNTYNCWCIHIVMCMYCTRQNGDGLNWIESINIIERWALLGPPSPADISVLQFEWVMKLMFNYNVSDAFFRREFHPWSSARVRQGNMQELVLQNCIYQRADPQVLCRSSHIEVLQFSYIGVSHQYIEWNVYLCRWKLFILNVFYV